MGAATYDEWMVQLLENFFFILDVVHVLRLDDVHLFHGFDCHFGIGVPLQPSKLYISEGTCSENI